MPVGAGAAAPRPETVRPTGVHGPAAVREATVAREPAAALTAREEEATQELPAAAEHPGASLRLYVLTAEPGDFVWERFGHNLLRIVDEAAGTDVAWNWGLFRFDQEGFLPRLARGTMLYSMGGFPTRQALLEYEAAGRAVWSQELDLTAEEKWAIQQAVHENALPGNVQYRYDYYRDNCSTRIRDLVDAALGGRFRELTDRPTGTTYRWHTRRLLQMVPWAYAGIYLVLGNPADEPITAWQEMFLPMKLREHLDRATVVRDGREVPLVRLETRILTSARPPVPDAPASQLPVALVVGVLWAGLIVGLGRAAARNGAAPARAGLVLAAGAWAAVSGLAGLLLGAAWLFTDHVFWRWNENLLQVDPLSLGVAAGLAVLLVRRAPPPWLATLATVVAGVSVLGVLVQALPGFDQVNGEVLALAVPVNVAVALAVRWAASRRGPDRPGEGSRGAADPAPAA